MGVNKISGNGYGEDISIVIGADNHTAEKERQEKTYRDARLR